MTPRTKATVAAMISGIIVAHIFLWRSEMDLTYKIVFTTINAVAWTIILAPIFLIERWLDAVQKKNRTARDAENSDH